jgi:predicted porin
MDERRNNTINYQSPKFAGGLGINLQYTPDENTEDDFDDALFSGAVFWDKGGLYVGGDVQYKEDGAYGLTTGNKEETAYSLAAGYKFGFGLRIAGFYRGVKSMGNVDGADMKGLFGGGASYTFGKNVVKAQVYGSSEDFDQAGYDAYCGGLTSCDSVVYAIGWDHNFSKQTTLQVGYSGADNDDGVGATPWEGGGSDQVSSIGQDGAVGNKPSGFMANLVHKF